MRRHAVQVLVFAALLVAGGAVSVSTDSCESTNSVTFPAASEGKMVCDKTGVCSGCNVGCAVDQKCEVECGTNTESCTGMNVVCPKDADCTVKCQQTNACKNLRVTCPENAARRCIVQCTGVNSCQGMVVSQHSASQGAAMIVSCSANGACVGAKWACPASPTSTCVNSCSYSACDNVEITGGAGELRLLCQSNACRDAKLTCPATAKCSLECAESMSCARMQITTPEPGTGALKMPCLADSSCLGAVVQCPAAAACEFHCQSSSSCKDAKVDCPRDGDCSLDCVGFNSCGGAEVTAKRGRNGNTLLKCTGSDGCKNAKLDCGTSTSCSTRCTGSNACTNMEVKCPDPKSSCEVDCVQGNSCTNSKYHCPDKAGAGTCALSCQSYHACDSGIDVSGNVSPVTCTNPTFCSAYLYGIANGGTAAPGSPSPGGSTPAPPTPAPPTVSPPTPAPPTNSPPTPTPPTPSPPTPSPLTVAPPTPSPLTVAPPTPSPLTVSPPTPVPLVPASPTTSPTLAPTDSPAGPTVAPTDAPVLATPSPGLPVTAVPMTAHATQGPTAAPDTDAPPQPTEAVTAVLTVAPALIPNHKETAGIVSLSSTAALTGSGSAGRLGIIKDFGCEVDDVDLKESEQLDFEFHPTGVALGSSGRKYMKGALLMNPVVLAGSLLLLLGVSYGMHVFMHAPMQQALGNARTPGLVYIPYLFLLQGTSLVGSRMSFYPSSGESAAVTLAAWVVLVACVASPAVIYFFVLRHVSREAFQILDPALFPREGLESRKVYTGRVALLYRFVYGENVWVNRTPESMFAEKYGVMFDNLREGCQLFPLAELTMMNCLSMLAAWRPASLTHCDARNTLVCLLFFAFMVAVLYVRPYSSRLDNAISALLATMMFLAVLLMTIGLWVSAASTSGWFAAAGHMLLVCAMLVLIKAIWDLLSYAVEIWLGRKAGAREAVMEEGRLARLKAKMRKRGFSTAAPQLEPLALQHSCSSNSNWDTMSEPLMSGSMRGSPDTIPNGAAHPLTRDTDKGKDKDKDSICCTTQDASDPLAPAVKGNIIITCVAVEDDNRLTWI